MYNNVCYLQAMDGSNCVGAIVCKLDIHRKVVKRGYIAMLAVDEKYRKRKIGKSSITIMTLVSFSCLGSVSNCLVVVSVIIVTLGMMRS